MRQGFTFIKVRIKTSLDEDSIFGKQFLDLNQMEGRGAETNKTANVCFYDLVNALLTCVKFCEKKFIMPLLVFIRLENEEKKNRKNVM